MCVHDRYGVLYSYLGRYEHLFVYPKWGTDKTQVKSPLKSSLMNNKFLRVTCKKMSELKAATPGMCDDPQQLCPWAAEQLAGSSAGQRLSLPSTSLYFTLLP